MQLLCYFTLHPCKTLFYCTPDLFCFILFWRQHTWWIWTFWLCIYTFFRLTFARVMRKKSTEEFSCIPYIIALLNCLLYTWYGLPVVSYRWENFPVVTINGLGILLEFSFILIYFWFTSPRGKASYLHLISHFIIYWCVQIIRIHGREFLFEFLFEYVGMKN